MKRYRRQFQNYLIRSSSFIKIAKNIMFVCVYKSVLDISFMWNGVKITTTCLKIDRKLEIIQH